MRILNENKLKDIKFIEQYLYNKFIHSAKSKGFFLNFSDISHDLSGFIGRNYSDYIATKKIPLTEVPTLTPDTLKKLKMLHRDSLTEYNWTNREDLLANLKEIYNDPDYCLKETKKQRLLDAGVSEKAIAKIKNDYVEWKSFEQLRFREKKNCINDAIATFIFYDITPKIVELNLDDDDLGLEYNFNLKVKNKNKMYYYSGRAFNNMCFTRNDLEPREKNPWDKTIVDQRENRSEYFKKLEELGYYIIDLGDMSSNFPNMLNCIKTGKYEDIDFHSIVAEENGISRKVAKMAAVRCCFNSRKIDVLYGLLDGVDLDKIKYELDEMESSGIFYIENNKLRLKKGMKVSDAHEFFSERSDNEFFKYCCDFLTSWDACNVKYKNNLAPSDLSLITSAVEINIIYEALQKGFKIVNAYDHAYLISKNKNDFYDWKGNYKKWAEKLAKLFLQKNKIENFYNYSTLNEKLEKFQDAEQPEGNDKTLYRKMLLNSRRLISEDFIYDESGYNEYLKAHDMSERDVEKPPEKRFRHYRVTEHANELNKMVYACLKEF